MNATLRWVILGLSPALLLSCSKKPVTKDPAASQPIRTVNVARVESRPMERIVTVTGSLAPQEQATVSVKVAGRLKMLAVDLGSVVRQGDTLAQVEPRDYELRLQQAMAALAQARTALGLPPEGTNDVVDLEKTSIVKQAKAVLEEAAKNRERVLNLSKEGISSKSELDTVEAAYSVALNRHETALEEARTRLAALAQRRAELELARQQLSDTTVRAPFDGAVQARIANLGEFLTAGAPVLTLVKTDPLRLRLEVPEREAAHVRSGQPVRLAVEGDTNSYTGKISRLSPAFNEQNRILLVEADVPNDGSLRAGSFVRAEIIINERDEGLAVPPAALITFAGLEKAIVVQNDKALEKIITTGRRGPDWVEVISGLKSGELVVVEPGNLRTGQPVKIVDTQTSETPKATGTAGP